MTAHVFTTGVLCPSWSAAMQAALRGASKGYKYRVFGFKTSYGKWIYGATRVGVHSSDY